MNCKEFLEYDNIVKLGEKYPEKVVKMIGENKVLYTPENDPIWITFVIKGDKFPEWAKDFVCLKVK